jgi:hypothetical protein
VRGRVTVATRDDMLVLDDLVPATSPATTSGTGRAADDSVGLSAGDGVLFARNQLQNPRRRRNDTTAAWKPPFEEMGPSPAVSDGVTFHGYSRDISFNRCAMIFPPPSFPTTGRWTLRQCFEVDPQGFTIADWFARRSRRGHGGQGTGAPLPVPSASARAARPTPCGTRAAPPRVGPWPCRSRNR